MSIWPNGWVALPKRSLTTFVYHLVSLDGYCFLRATLQQTIKSIGEGIKYVKKFIQK
jgi:hypothetical protein